MTGGETREIGWISPFDALARVGDLPHAALFHSAPRSRDGDWSILVAGPKSTLESRSGLAVLNGATCDGPAFDCLAGELGQPDGPVRVGDLVLPFTKGAVGFVGYEMAGVAEPSLALRRSPFDLPDLWFGFFDGAALFHHPSKRAFLTGDNGLGGRLQSGGLDSDQPCSPRIAATFERSSFSRGRYESAVAEVMERIRNGDIFQANIAQRLEFSLTGAPPAHDLGRAFLGASQASFGAVIRHPEGTLVSNSPERFFRVRPGAEGLRIVADPIKGTALRDPDPARDAALAQALSESAKDRAENIMIADLTRNDLARICRDHSITEDYICRIESYAGLHHLVSRISGTLADGVGSADALASMFPCGSITGAPKIEAMRVIADIEREGRGPYCGAIGYIDVSGAAEFSVAIRTAIVDRDHSRFSLSVGGGITLRSDPSAEYDETLLKARSALASLKPDFRGLS